MAGGVTHGDGYASPQSMRRSQSPSFLSLGTQTSRDGTSSPMSHRAVMAPGGGDGSRSPMSHRAGVAPGGGDGSRSPMLPRGSSYGNGIGGGSPLGRRSPCNLGDGSSESDSSPPSSPTASSSSPGDHPVPAVPILALRSSRFAAVPPVSPPMLLPVSFTNRNVPSRIVTYRYI